MIGEDYNSCGFNSGDFNAGNWNDGDFNAGNRNSGDYNSGDHNTGDYNSGNWNTGDQNGGNWNTGNYNSGDYNTGDQNSGDHNAGNYNSGDWNKCDFSNGCFNTVEQKIYLFNRPSEWTYGDWISSEARPLLDRIPCDLEYVLYQSMTDEEKTEHPEAEVAGGYLKKLDGSERTAWWRGLSCQEKSVITSIPNFDKAIFKEITGIDVDES